MKKYMLVLRGIFFLSLVGVINCFADPVFWGDKGCYSEKKECTLVFPGFVKSIVCVKHQERVSQEKQDVSSKQKLQKTSNKIEKDKAKK